MYVCCPQPPSKEDLRQWLRVLMAETATSDVPEGLEEFFVEGDERPDDLLEAEYTDIVGASILTSWVRGWLGSQTLKNRLLSLALFFSLCLSLCLCSRGTT